MSPLSPRDIQTAVTPEYGTDQKKGEDHMEVKAEAGGRMTLVRRVALCMGLTASEAMGVFSMLTCLPLLQALGSPVYLMTLPGAISAASGLVFVPLIGWFADRGPNPQKRKKPVTIAAFCVGLLGMSLNLLASVLSVSQSPRATHHNSTNSVINETVHHNTSVIYLTNNGSLLSVDNQSFLSSLDKMAKYSQAPYFPNESLVGTAVSEEARTGFGISSCTMFGLPMLVVVAMAGFIFIDFGFDLTNCAVKALMLTHSSPADHVSLVITGVFMAALGGCCTSVSGLVDLGRFLPDSDPVFSQVIVQLCTLIVLGILCCACSILSAPPLASSTNTLPSSDDMEPATTDTEPLLKAEDSTSRRRHGSGRRISSTLMHPRTEAVAADNVFFATMTPAEALMSNSVQLERSFMHLSMSQSLTQSHHLLSLHQHHHMLDSEMMRLVLPEASQYEAIPEDTTEASRGAGTPGEGVLDHPKLKLMIVWLATFFTGCSTLIYNVTIADYVGKKVYGGNPQADPDSEEYALYQQGMRTGAMCVLIMSLTYITSALSQNKVLSVISPKAEYVLVSVGLSAMMTLMHQTSSLYAIVLGSVMVGANRTALYTVPFLLATDLAQQMAASEKSSEAGGSGNSWQFGSLMALMTAAFPSAYLVISCVVGPLVDATGDPSAPLLMAIVSSMMAAITISCYRSAKKT
ncbi:hypothetical protein ACOMHN_013485 [Nucella lapillus]